jgi:hypothetical protein
MADATTWARLERIVRWQVDAGANRTLAHLPKDEVGRPERAPVKFQPHLSEMTASVMDMLTDTKHRFRSRLTQRMRCVGASRKLSGAMPDSRTQRAQRLKTATAQQ